MPSLLYRLKLDQGMLLPKDMHCASACSISDDSSNNTVNGTSNTAVRKRRPLPRDVEPPSPSSSSSHEEHGDHTHQTEASSSATPSFPQHYRMDRTIGSNRTSPRLDTNTMKTSNDHSSLWSLPSPTQPSMTPPTDDPIISTRVRRGRPRPPLMQRAASAASFDSLDEVATVTRNWPLAFRVLRRHQPLIFASLIVLLGAVASAAILVLGIRGAKSASMEFFQTEAKEMVYAISNAYREYETLLLWVHESCDLIDAPNITELESFSLQGGDGVAKSLGFCSRRSFQHLVDHIDSLGLSYIAIQFAPNITSQAERLALERESAIYYKENNSNVTDVYVGIKAVDVKEGMPPNLYVSPEKPFYFPAHYVHPLEMNERVVDIDMYSYNKENIDIAFRLSKPVMENRGRVFRDPRPEVWGVGISHPGVPSSADAPNKTHAISRLVIRYIDLIARGASHLEYPTTDGLKVYMYDETRCHVQPGSCDPIFLAGTDIKQGGVMILYNETEYADLISHTGGRRVGLSYEMVVELADHQIRIVVIQNGETYQPTFTFAILGACILFVATVLVTWVFHKFINRTRMLHQIKSDAANEKATMALAQAQRERLLNDFMAHEVRNPLSSALAALSFAREAASQRVADPEVRDSLMEDLGIVQNSLDYIEDLLRNMLDIHRTNEQDVALSHSLINLKTNILEPCRTMVGVRRGGRDFDLQVECSDNLWVEVDPLRVEQIILNLALNATKFVPPGGFIRLRADVVKNSVHLYVEDSGPGIPPEHRDRLFEKYQKSLDVINQGSGIGLYICKTLSDVMGADIWLDESFDSGVPGCPGARFVVDLNEPPQSNRRRSSNVEVRDEYSDVSVSNGGDDSPVRNLIAGDSVCADHDTLSICTNQDPQSFRGRADGIQDDEEAQYPVENEVNESFLVADPGNTPAIDYKTVVGPPAMALPLQDASFLSAHLIASCRADIEYAASQSTLEAGSLSENKLGKGSEEEAKRCLPKSLSSRQLDPLSSSSLHSELPDYLSVLFVDDDTTLRKLFCRSVKRISPNWKVDEAPNGKAALDLVRNHTYDLIFMDQYMESTQVTLLGTECVRMMREAGVASIICGLSANEEKDHFLATGADSFILKPFPCERKALQKAILNALKSGEVRAKIAVE